MTTKPITDVVYSHHHSDHVGAMSVFPERATRYAHRAAAQRLQLLDDPDRPLPSVVFDDTLTIEAGDHSLQLTYPGPNHSEGNSFIYAPQQKVLMLVDVIFPGWVPFSNLALSAYVPGYIQAHEQALAYDFDHLVGGHVTRPGTPEDVRVQLEYMTDLRVTAEAALSSVDLARTMPPSTRATSGRSSAPTSTRSRPGRLTSSSRDGRTASAVRTSSPSPTPGPWRSRCASTSTLSAPSAPPHDALPGVEPRGSDQGPPGRERVRAGTSVQVPAPTGHRPPHVKGAPS